MFSGMKRWTNCKKRCCDFVTIYLNRLESGIQVGSRHILHWLDLELQLNIMDLSNKLDIN